MTRQAPAPAGSPAADRGRARRIVAALAVTQTVGYGALYYSFAVFLTPIARDLHTSATAVTAALTIATLTGAAAAVPVGAWLDRHGGRGLMSLGSVAGTALLALMSTVDTLVGLYAVWLGIGLASAMVLYEAAFAVVITWHPSTRGRANALLAITVVAGFASTIFLPLTGALVHIYGWRTAVLVLAAVHGALTIPLHTAVLRRAPASPKRQPPPDFGTTRRTAVRAALHDRRFWLLALAFVAHAAALSALAVHLVAYLIDAGHPATFAATVTGLLGVLSVAGRLATTGLQRRIRPTTVVAAVFAVQAFAAAALPLIGHRRAGAVIGVIGFGLGFGVATIARPALLADRYGTTGFATISGLLTVPMTIAKAGAPLAAALLYGIGGYTPVLALVALACAVAATAVLTVGSPPALARIDVRNGYGRSVVGRGWRYRYVGPADVAAVGMLGGEGQSIRSREDFSDWVGTVDARDLVEPFTYVVGVDGVLRLAPRRSEHVACAGGGEVLAAGEIAFLRRPGGWMVSEVSNQSTGYCPDPSSWSAVASALDRAGLDRPGGFTSEFVFRRCPECKELNVVKDEDLVCCVCGSDLPRTWNVDARGEQARS